MRDETPCQKLMRMNAASDRVLTSFQPPYTISPYKQTDFNEKVKNLCSSYKNSAKGLKICKTIIVGNVSVGKTSLVNRFCHQIFDKDYKATIGVDFEVERFDILQVPFNLQLWDTAGQERFKCIASSYYRGANVIIVVFDLTDVESLLKCKQWFYDAIKDNNGNPHVFLVGTKKDLITSIGYEKMEKGAIEIAKEIKAEFWPVSSKSGENVNLLFYRVAVLSFDASVLRELDDSNEPLKVGSRLVRVHLDENCVDLIEKKKENCVCNI